MYEKRVIRKPRTTRPDCVIFSSAAGAEPAIFKRCRDLSNAADARAGGGLQRSERKVSKHPRRPTRPDDRPVDSRQLHGKSKKCVQDDSAARQTRLPAAGVSRSMGSGPRTGRSRSDIARTGPGFTALVNRRPFPGKKRKFHAFDNNFRLTCSTSVVGAVPAVTVKTGNSLFSLWQRLPWSYS